MAANAKGAVARSRGSESTAKETHVDPPRETTFLWLIALLLPLFAARVEAQFGFATNNGALTIVTYSSGLVGNVVIPSTTNGMPITSIGDYAFYYSNIRSVTVPDTVTNIGNYAFQACGHLLNVYISANLMSLGVSAFANGALTAISLPDTLYNLAPGTFGGCSNLSSVTLPGALTNIDAAAFQFCTRLGGLTIPATVLSIGFGAYSDCSKLTNIIIPGTVTTIGANAFIAGSEPLIFTLSVNRRRNKNCHRNFFSYLIWALLTHSNLTALKPDKIGWLARTG